MGLGIACKAGNRCARVGPEHTDVFSQADVVAAFGSAEGTLAVEGELPKENHWNAPAAWRAVVRDGLIAEWQVYADNQSARKIMGVQNPLADSVGR